ncbi:MAG: sulfatase-like hydrolase/transferase [Candidatus Binataceae bacterium]
MARRWWLLFRSLAVITVLFLAPVLAVQTRSSLYFLSTRDAAGQLALGILAVLLLEALCAAILAIILGVGRALGLWSDRADDTCAGLLTFASWIMVLLGLVSPLNAMIDPVANASVALALILAVIALLTFFGWRKAFALFNRLNQSSQIVLAAVPILLIPVFAAGIGWRGFDPMPQARSGGANPAAQPNVVLISFDALTAEDMSLYGYRLPTTPRLEQFSQRSYNFVNFVSTADFTTPAVASMLTGQYSLSNRVFQLYGHIPNRLREHNLAWILRQHGYTTAAIVTNPAAHPLTLRVADSFSILLWPPMASWFFPGTFLLQMRHSLLFDAANNLAILALRNFGCLFSRFNRASWVEPRAVFASGEEFIRGARAPYFLWIHLYPPHSPYVTNARFQGRFLPGSEFTSQAQFLWLMSRASYPPAMQPKIDLMRLRYDESIAECDSALGDFLDWMAANHRGANTILAVTSDHGENFSGGWWGHESPDLRYTETHIPLLISLPGQTRNYTETENCDLSDLAPTLLAALGIDRPPWMDGHPLIGAAHAASSPEPGISMYLAQSSAFGRPAFGTIAENSGPYHLVMYFPSGRFELFNIARDPEETHPAFAQAPPGLATALLADIRRRFCAEINCVRICGP